MKEHGIIFDSNICHQAETVCDVREILLNKWKSLLELQNQGIRIPDSEFQRIYSGVEELCEIEDAQKLKELREELNNIDNLRTID